MNERSTTCEHLNSAPATTAAVRTRAARRNNTAAYCRYRSVIAANASRVLAYTYSTDGVVPMATLTIRNVPDEVVARLKKVAANKGHSMEQELRELLKTRYPARAEVLDRVEENWKNLPPVSAEEIDQWIAEARNHPV